MRPGCVSAPICKTPLCIKMCLLASFKPQNATSLLDCPEQFSWFLQTMSPPDFGNSSTTALSFHSKMESLQSWMHSPPRASLTSHKPSHPASCCGRTPAAAAELLQCTHSPGQRALSRARAGTEAAGWQHCSSNHFWGLLTSICSRFGSSSCHQSLQQAATLSSAASTASVPFTKGAQFQGVAGLQSHTPYQQDGKYSGTLQPYQMWGFWVRLACVG